MGRSWSTRSSDKIWRKKKLILLGADLEETKKTSTPAGVEETGGAPGWWQIPKSQAKTMIRRVRDGRNS